MSANPLDFAKLATNSALINNAQYGGTGKSFVDKFLLPAMDFLGSAYGAYQGGADGGLAIPGLVGMTQGMSRRNMLNNILKQQHNILKQQQQAALAAQMGNSQTIEGINSAIKGGVPQFGAYASPEIAKDFGKQFLERYGGVATGRGAVQDFPGMVQQGQGISGPAQPKSFAPVLQQEGVVPPQGQLEADPVLQAGVGYQANAPTISPEENPFMTPAYDPTDILNALGVGVEDTQKHRGMSIDEQNNIATQGINQYKANTDRKTADDQINRGYWTRPQPSGSLSEAELVNQLLNSGKIDVGQALGVLGGAGADPNVALGRAQTVTTNEIKAIDEQLKSLPMFGGPLRQALEARKKNLLNNYPGSGASAQQAGNKAVGSQQAAAEYLRTLKPNGR